MDKHTTANKHAETLPKLAKFTLDLFDPAFTCSEPFKLPRGICTRCRSFFARQNNLKLIPHITTKTAPYSVNVASHIYLLLSFSDK